VHQAVEEEQIFLIEELSLEELSLIAFVAATSEKGRRRPIYNAFKWWGRRYAVLAQALLAALILEPREYKILQHLLTGKDKDDYRRYIEGRTRGKLIVDPFVGGATILVEAMLMGFDVYGTDINPAAVAVAQATLGIVSRDTCNQLRCLENALLETATELAAIWSFQGKTIIHLLLAPEEDGYVEAPAWLATISREPRKIIVLDPANKNGLRVVEGNEAEGYTPTAPTIRISAKELPEEAPGLRAYAAEITDHGKRRFVPFYTEEGKILAAALKNSNPSLRRATCTKIPRLRETERLRYRGLRCWEQIYTPRQLLSLRAFVRKAEKLGCGWLSRLIVGNATRTTSLLAMYYQPYNKVNPGLVIKSYWLPRYPVELNPLAYAYTRKGIIKSAGRGTIATYIAALHRACRYTEHIDANAKIYKGDARDPEMIPKETYAILTDPPYPGMQNYYDMSIIYLYWLGEELKDSNERKLLGGDSYVKLMRDFSRAAARRLRTGTPMVLLLGGDVDTLSRSLVEIAKAGFGLRRLYWLPGEAPGKLGRSKQRGIFIAVYRYAMPHRNDAVEPLEHVKDIVEKLDKMHNGIKKGQKQSLKESLNIDVEEEKERTKRISETVMASIIRSQVIER